MSEQTLRRLVIGLAVLVVLYAGVRVTTALTRPKAVTGGALATAIGRLHGDTISGALVTSPKGERIELAHNAAGSAWTVNGFRADSSAVDRLRRAVSEATMGDLVARNRENHARLGVSQDSAWTVELRAKRDTTRFLLGSSGARYPSAYVRLPNEDAVYEVLGGLREALALSVADWRDKTILTTDTARIRTVVITADRRRVDLARADSGKWHERWSGGAGHAAGDSVHFQDVLSELSRFDASGFPADTATFTGKETRRVVALGEKGDTVAALEVTGDGSVWRARVLHPKSEQIYDVASYRVDRIAPNLMPPKPAPKSAAKAKSGS